MKKRRRKKNARLYMYFPYGEISNNETVDVAHLRNLTDTFCRTDIDSRTNHYERNDDNLNCSFTFKHLSKWWGYIVAVGFTIGKCHELLFFCSILLLGLLQNRKLCRMENRHFVR